MKFFNRFLAATLAALHLMVFVPMPMAQATMLGTADVLQQQHQQVEREQLLSMLDDQAVKDKLVAMGLVPQEQMMGMRMMMAMFAKPAEGNPDQLNSEIEFREGGQIFANGQQVK